MTARKLHACHNRDPLQDITMVQAGWADHGSVPWGATRKPSRLPVMVSIPVPMTKDCQYSIRTPDPKCAGCKWNQQESNAS